KPVFDNITAGLSGPAIRPIALRMVWELWEALRTPPGKARPVPIVGAGGIAGAEDALEFLMAGASAVQTGSATFPHPQTMIEIIDGIEEHMTKHGLSNPEELSIRKAAWYA
ncbi:MAG: dihydroorotate dehydrogenase, partial [Treponema sp.]|nr:dihydroorotate dehydrogenase [Treponema sp.]